jgi:hypothetical protein
MVWDIDFIKYRYFALPCCGQGFFAAKNILKE